jgi:hypothetical protein
MRLLLALMAALLLALLLIGGLPGRRTDPGPDPGGSPDGRGGPPPAIPLADPVREEPLRSASGGEEDQPVTSRASAVPAVQPPAPEPGTLLIRVVDPSGAPVPRCPVAVVVHHPDLPIDGMPCGQGLTAEEGVARIELDGLPSIRLSDPTFGAGIDLAIDPPVETPLSAAERTEGGVVTLTLPDRYRYLVEDLVVRVLDTDDAPVVGVEVVHEARQVGASQWSELGRATTGADGRAAIPREGEREIAFRQMIMGGRHEFVLRTSIPLREPVRVPTPDHRGETVLRLPPTGSVVVTVLDAGGEPVAKEAWVSLSYRPLGAPQGQRFERGKPMDVRDGRARLTPLGLELELDLSAGLRDSSVEAVRVLAPGPGRAGEEVDVALRLGPERPVLAGRLMDESGPRAGMRFALAFEPAVPDFGNEGSGPRRVRWSHHVTGDDGRFAIPFTGGRAAEGGWQVWIEESSPISGAPDGWIAGCVRVPTSSPLPEAGRLDLGDLTPEPLPLLAAGIVRDPGGRPVERARVRLAYALEPDSRRHYNLGSPQTVGADGAFAFHGLDRVPELLVSATHPDWRSPDDQPVEAGSARVLIDLLPPEPPPPSPPTGQVRGSVRLDEEVSTRTLELVFRAGKRKATMELYRAPFLRELPEGTWTVAVGSRETDWVFHESAPFEVVADRETTLPPIDLTGQLRLLRLRLVHADGRPLDRDRVTVIGPGGEGARLRTDSDGRVSIVTRVGDRSFDVWIDGVARTVLWADEEQELVLGER